MAKVSAKKTEGTWEIRHGRVSAKPRPNKPRSVEDLQYNNPYRYKIERVWFDGRVIFATEQGEVDVDPKKVKVAQEYQIVYAVKLTPKRKLARESARGASRVSSTSTTLSRDEEVQRDLAVQLRHRPARLRPERSSLRARLPPQRLRDQKSLVFEN